MQQREEAQRRATPGRDETQTAVFQASDGTVIPPQRVWDKRLEKFGGPKSIPYEELEGMFLDQFLLRYFYSLMPEDPLLVVVPGCRSPWQSFWTANPWAKEMPLLFEQMTGYSLNEIQLNNAIAEWVRRVSKPPIPVAQLKSED